MVINRFLIKGDVLVGVEHVYVGERFVTKNLGWSVVTHPGTSNTPTLRARTQLDIDTTPHHAIYWHL